MKKAGYAAILELNGYIFGWLVMLLLISVSSQAHAAIQNLSELSAENIEFDSVGLIFAAAFGAFGSYLVFGEGKKWPPSTMNVGHVLLGFGTGMFVTKGALELIGRVNASHDLLIFFTFMFAVLGYFLLQLAVSLITSPHLKKSLEYLIPDFITKGRGGRYDDDSYS